MSAACREVSESLLLFMRQQNGHMSKSILKQLNPALQITISQLAREEGPNSLGYNVHVLSSGLGAYFVDGRLFLHTLCEHGEALRCLLKRTASYVEGASLLQLKCRRIGDCLNVSCFKIEGFSSSDEKQPVIRESVEPRLEHLHSTSLLISYEVTFSNLEELRRETDILSTHLHLMHLINPDVTMKLTVEDNLRIEMFHVDFETEPFKVLTKTPFKLAKSLQHFIEHKMIPVQQSKLYMLKGDTYTIPGCIDTLMSSFKIYSAAAVVPHLQLRNRKKIPANRLCKQLHVSVFGPFNTPLISANSQANFPLSCLAEWGNYGLSVRQSNKEETRQVSSTSSSVSPSFLCELSNTRTTPSFSSSVSANHLLVLFIFLEETSQKHKSFIGDSSQWKRDMELLHQLRVEFQNVVVTHSKKFQNSVHSVLNKLICNYGSHAKTSNVMSVAIPLISDAVASIVKNSSNEEFKRMCRELTEAEGDNDIRNYVNQKLWKMAKDKLQVTDHSGPSSHNPDEPTSPEIIQAANDGSNGADPSQLKRDLTSAIDYKEDEQLIERASTDIQTDREELTDFVRHTLSTSSVLQTRLLSKATTYETRRDNDDGDCFGALEMVDESMAAVQQTREDYNDMELTDMQIVQHDDESLVAEEIQEKQASSDSDSSTDLKESHESGFDEQDCLDNTDIHCDTQVSSPSFLDLHQPVETTYMSPVNNNHSNFDVLEYFNENTLCTDYTNDSDGTVADDGNSTISTMRERGPVSCNESSNHPDSTDEQPGTNDSSFTELEHFDDNSPMCDDVVEHHIPPLHNPVESNVMINMTSAAYSYGFDELEYFSDSADSTCMECTENHTTMSSRNENDIRATASDSDKREQVAHNNFHEPKCIGEETSAWSDVAEYHHSELPDSDSEQCLPEEEAVTYTSDDEWEELAHSSSTCTLTNNNTVEPTHDVSTPTPIEQLEECHTPSVPSVCNHCDGEEDHFDQLEFCEETLSTHAPSVNKSIECHVTMQDFDWD